MASLAANVAVAVARVLREFLADASRSRYGYDLMKTTGYPSGKLYPILARLQHPGWLDRTQERADPARECRSARDLYLLSEDGAVRARQALAALSAQLSLAPSGRLHPRPEGGTA